MFLLSIFPSKTVNFSMELRWEFWLFKLGIIGSSINGKLATVHFVYQASEFPTFNPFALHANTNSLLCSYMITNNNTGRIKRNLENKLLKLHKNRELSRQIRVIYERNAHFRCGRVTGRSKRNFNGPSIIRSIYLSLSELSMTYIDTKEICNWGSSGSRDVLYGPA